MPRITRLAIHAGPLGAQETLGLMRQQILSSDSHREVKDLAASIVRNIEPRDEQLIAQSILNWVRNNMRYVRDVDGVEELIAPHVQLARAESGAGAYGDCDDFTMLLASLFRAVGLPPRLEAYSVKGDVYDHAALSVQIMGDWVPVEGTRSWPLGHRYPSKLPVLMLEV